jgi:SnoaL-like domain
MTPTTDRADMSDRRDHRPGEPASRDVTAAADTSAITQLLLREREGRDRGWWQQMREALDPDAHIRIAWFNGRAEEFIDRSEQMSKGALVARHALGPVVVYLGGDRAAATVAAQIEIRLPVDGVEADLTSHARLLYRAERRESGWRLLGFTAIYERDALTPSIPGQRLDVDVTELERLRPSYRMLAYVLGRSGLAVNQELPGDDRPDEVEALYRELFEWVGVASPDERR